MNNEFFNCFKVALYKGEIVILKLNLLGSQVMFSDESVWMTCEIAPISEFEIIGDL
jgi:hypothetical protein